MTGPQADGSLRDRIHGMVLGLACAEAMGAPCLREAQSDQRTVGRSGAAGRALPPSSMTKMLGAVVGHLGVDGQHAGRTSSTGSSAQLIRTLHELDAGRPPHRGRPGAMQVPAAGNGAAAWSPAIAVVDHDLDRIAATARASAGLTHPHEIGQDGAVAVAVAICVAFRTPQRPLQFGPEMVLPAISSRVSSDAFRRAVGEVRALFGRRRPRPVPDVVGTGTTALESVPAALAAVLRHPDSYVATVQEAVGFGGDVSRISAIAGAISAARLGTAAIPVAWLERMDDVHGLHRLADVLVAGAMARRGPTSTAAIPGG